MSGDGEFANLRMLYASDDELYKRALDSAKALGLIPRQEWHGGTYVIPWAAMKEAESWRRWQRALGRWPIFWHVCTENRPPLKRWRWKIGEKNWWNK